MKSILAFIILIPLLILSCGSPKELPTNMSTTPLAELTKDWHLYKNSVPLNVQNVLIIGDKMTINISYSGGCKEHNFKLVGNQFITNSNPPERFCRLYHENNGDDCRELVNSVLEFDISAFALPNGQQVNLKLEGYDKPISYSKK